MNNKDFFDDNGIYATEGQIVLRAFREDDRDAFISLKKDVSDVGVAYVLMPEFAESSWQEVLTGSDGNIHICLDYNNDGFAGYLNFQHPDREVPEIGIDLVKKLRNRGIGYSALKLLMKHAGTVAGYKNFDAEIYTDNEASMALVRKFGAKEVDVMEGEFSKIVKTLKKALGQEEIDKVWSESKDVYDREMARKIVRYRISLE